VSYRTLRRALDDVALCELGFDQSRRWDEASRVGRTVGEAATSQRTGSRPCRREQKA